MNFDGLRFGSDRAGDHDQFADLVQGKGSYTSDIEVAGRLYACFVRSVQAHAHICGIDTIRILSLPGVHAAIAGREMREAGFGVIPPLSAFHAGTRLGRAEQGRAMTLMDLATFSF